MQPLRNGAYYHIYTRGNNRASLFREARNYPYFLDLYRQHILPIAETYAYCLLGNHFHLLVRTHDITAKPPSKAFSYLFNACARAYNKAYGRTNTLFQRPFRRIEVTTEAYMLRLIGDIHRNPQCHGLVRDFRAWPYSSYSTLTSMHPTALQRAAVITWFADSTGFGAITGVKNVLLYTYSLGMFASAEAYLIAHRRRAMTTTADPIQPALAPFVESDPFAPAAELQAVIEDQGYLFFRSIVPVADVLAVRRDVLELCAGAGWLDPDHDLMEGIVAPGQPPLSEGQPAYMAVYRPVLKLPRFHDFPAHPALRHVAQALVGGDVLIHPRRIGRMTFPNYAQVTTPPHQDFYYIRGAVQTYSCWAPLGDCPIALGGLAIWPGSHKRGYIDHTVHHPGAVGGCGVPIDPAQAHWVTADFRAGDALFFTSYTIHKALPNLTSNQMRLSTDNRYQRPEDAIDPGALKPHYNLS